MNMNRTSFFKVYGNGIVAKTLFLVAFMLCMQTINAQEDLDAKYATEHHRSPRPRHQLRPRLSLHPHDFNIFCYPNG